MKTKAMFFQPSGKNKGFCQKFLKSAMQLWQGIACLCNKKTKSFP